MERLPNIRHFAALVATIELGTVTAAARKLNLTQPALTQSISRLESELDCQLFERSSKNMHPTKPALLLSTRASQALELIASPRVTSTQMRAFLALARAGSYSGAAAACGLSSASLHRAVNDLSIALGETLVERKGKHLVLTRKGELRARKFGLASAELRSGLSEVAGWLGREGEMITIGAMPLSRADWLPNALLEHCAMHHKVGITVVEGSHSELVVPLRNGEIDFLLGALRNPQEARDLIQECVFVDRPQVIMRRDHPLAGRKQVKASDANKYSWVLPPEPTPLRHYWNQMVENCGIQSPPVPIECGSALTIRELLLGSDMLSLLSPAQMKVELAAGVLHASIPPEEISREIGITTRPDWRPTPTQRELLKSLRAYSQ